MLRFLLGLGVLGFLCPATGTLGFAPTVPSRSVFGARTHSLCSNQHSTLTVLMADKDRSSETMQRGLSQQSNGIESNIRRYGAHIRISFDVIM